MYISGKNLNATHESIITDSWVLNAPGNISEDSPILVIPTVHPRGDRRIVRCAQVALDLGFRLKIIWLGDGRASNHLAVSEHILPTPKNAKERILTVRKAAKIARQYDAALWHIHDYYFLLQARRWHRSTKKPIIYDVHEYYAEYYSAKLPLPNCLRRMIASGIEKFQVSSARKFGGANVVTEKMSLPFRKSNVPTSVAPNYPLLAQFSLASRPPFERRRWTVLHIGSLSRNYGSEHLVELARVSSSLGLPFKFQVIERYSSAHDRDEFQQLIKLAGFPDSLELLPPRPSHEMPSLIASAGFGLSLLANDDGQNDEAIPSKNYEHLLLGLVAVATPRRAQASFIETNAVGITLNESDPKETLQKMAAIANDPVATEAKLCSKSIEAKKRYTWEQSSAPALGALYEELMG